MAVLRLLGSEVMAKSQTGRVVAACHLLVREDACDATISGSKYG